MRLPRPVAALLPFALYASGPGLAVASAPLLARALDPGARGSYSLCLAVSALASTLANAGQAECYAADLQARSYASAVHRLSLVAVCGVLAGVVSTVACLMLQVPLSSSLITGVALPFMASLPFFVAGRIAVGDTSTPAVQATGSGIVRVLAVAACFFLGVLTLPVALLCTLGSSGLSTLYVLRRWLATGPPVATPRLDLGRSFVRALPVMLRTASPVLGFALLTAVLLRADVFVIGALSTHAQVGIYAVAVTVSEAALAVSSAFKNRMQKACYEPDVVRTLTRLTAVLLAAGLLIFAGLWLAGGPVVRIVFGPQYTAAVPVLQLLAAAAPFQMLFDVGQGLLVVAGRRSSMLLASGLGALVTIPALAWLVPGHGAAGAAIASIIGYAVCAVACAVLFVRGGLPRLVAAGSGRAPARSGAR